MTFTFLIPPDDKDVEEDRDGKVEGITKQCLRILGEPDVPENVKVLWLKTVLEGQINPLCDKLRLALHVEPPDLVSVKGLLESIGEMGDKDVAGSDSAEARSHAAGTCSRWKKDGRPYAAQAGKYFLFVCVFVCVCVCVCVFD